MRKVEKLPVFGHKGSTYFFTVHSLQDEYPATAGVYVFVKRVPAPNALYTMVFVGHAASFKDGVLQMLNECMQANGVNAVALLPVEDEGQRQAVVRELVARYNPVCNNVANN